MKGSIIEESSFFRFIFSNTKSASFWLILRILAAYFWISDGWYKVTSKAWVGWQAGEEFKAFVDVGLKNSQHIYPNSADSWYFVFMRDFVSNNPWGWSNIISYTELFVGLAILLGLFTGFSAFLGLFVSLNYLLFGPTTSDPFIFILMVLLILGYKVAGFWGLDGMLTMSIKSELPAASANSMVIPKK